MPLYKLSWPWKRTPATQDERDLERSKVLSRCPSAPNWDYTTRSGASAAPVLPTFQITKTQRRRERGNRERQERAPHHGAFRRGQPQHRQPGILNPFRQHAPPRVGHRLADHADHPRIQHRGHRQGNEPAPWHARQMIARGEEDRRHQRDQIPKPGIELNPRVLVGRRRRSPAPGTAPRRRCARCAGRSAHRAGRRRPERVPRISKGP